MSVWTCPRCEHVNENPLWPWCGECSGSRYAAQLTEGSPSDVWTQQEVYEFVAALEARCVAAEQALADIGVIVRRRRIGGPGADGMGHYITPEAAEIARIVDALLSSEPGRQKP